MKVGDKVVVKATESDGSPLIFGKMKGIVSVCDSATVGNRHCIVRVSKEEFLKKGMDIQFFSINDDGTIPFFCKLENLVLLEKRKFFNFCIFKRLWRKI